MLCTSMAYAYRITKPLPITDYNERGMVIINDNFERIWNITNGRFNLNITTTNPDGVVDGEVGDMILYNDAGTHYLEINVDGEKMWRGVNLTDTP